MKRYINKEKSVELFNRSKHLVQMKECYHNIFRVSSSPVALEKLKSKEWAIEYGFLHVIDNLYTKHAYFVDLNTGEVIDPTLPVLDSFEKRGEVDYYPIYQFESWETYMKAVEKEEWKPCLTDFLFTQAKEKELELFKQNIYCIG